MVRKKSRLISKLTPHDLFIPTLGDQPHSKWSKCLIMVRLHLPKLGSFLLAVPGNAMTCALSSSWAIEIMRENGAHIGLYTMNLTMITLKTIQKGECRRKIVAPERRTRTIHTHAPSSTRPIQHPGMGRSNNLTEPSHEETLSFSQWL